MLRLGERWKGRRGTAAGRQSPTSRSLISGSVAADKTGFVIALGRDWRRDREAAVANRLGDSNRRRAIRGRAPWQANKKRRQSQSHHPKRCPATGSRLDALGSPLTNSVT